MSILSAQRRDSNEREIIQALRAAGVIVLQMDKSAGFDLLCAYAGQLYVVEIKREGCYTLEPAEMRVKRQLELADVAYHVPHDIDEALCVFGLEVIC